jgi:hypothetical protein
LNFVIKIKESLPLKKQKLRIEEAWQSWILLAG